MSKVLILWVDDEIDLLKPHIIFLEEKGFAVDTATNGFDALDEVSEKDYDIVFLDENMPGISGLETLDRIKAIKPGLPVVMITKSEEESIMEEAIGSKISDYLIKPVNSKQVLLSIKKNLDTNKLISQKTMMSYQREFREIGMSISDRSNFSEWTELYKRIVYWELELEKSNDKGMREILQMQKNEANLLFVRFVEQQYKSWINGSGKDIPLLSHTLFHKYIFPKIEFVDSVFVLVIDNFRYDQWKILQPMIEQYYRVVSDDIYSSILPTATQYARNALFAGLMPLEIEKKYARYWKNDQEDGLKNDFEGELLGELIKRLGKDYKYSYYKILNLQSGKRYVDSMLNYLKNKLNVVVYNFVDMLSHARTEMEIIRELADDEEAYRSLTLTWFKHSPLFDIIKKLAENKIPLIITTDHGMVKVDRPIKIVGDKNTNTNIRYKNGRNMDYESKDVFEMKNPVEYYLPKQNVSSAYVYAKNNDYFVYPNNYNHYVNYYKNTFQHGGVSMEEMLIPVVYLLPK